METFRNIAYIFLDAAYSLFHYFLALIIIAVLALILRRFMRFTAALPIAIIAVGGTLFYLVYHDIHTAFDTIAEEQLNDEPVRAITVHVYDTEPERPELRKTAEIEEEDIIDSVLHDFSGMRLRQDENARVFDRDFRLTFHTRTSLMTVIVDDDYLDSYRILNTEDHLQTLNELVENDGIEWEEESGA